RVLHGAHRVLDRQRMKAERVAEDERFRNRGRRQIDPEVDARRWVEPPAIEARDLLGLAVPMNEDADHNVKRRACGSLRRSSSQSPTLTDSAACAAARRATGMRYGDALT